MTSADRKIASAGKAAAGDRYVGEWGLFTDWCQATGRTALPATPGSVLAFLDDEHPTAGTAGRFLAGITARHAGAGYPSPCRGMPAAWVAAARAGTSTTGRQIAAELTEVVSRVPVAGWPAGMIGRRDRLAFLLHHLAGISIPALCTLSTDDLRVTRPGEVQVTVVGHPVAVYQEGPAGDPGLCLACATARWAQVLRHHRVFAHRVLADKLVATPGGPLNQSGRHVCHTIPDTQTPELKARWCPPGWPLFYGIDHRGHPVGAPVPDPAAPQTLRDALGPIARGTWARRPAPLPAARYDRRPPDWPAPIQRAAPAPVASNPRWHRDGLAARARDQALLADADAALDTFDAAAARVQQRMQAILTKQAP